MENLTNLFLQISIVYVIHSMEEDTTKAAKLLGSIHIWGLLAWVHSSHSSTEEEDFGEY